MRLIQNYWFISIITIFWKQLQGFSLLKLLILSKIQKTDLTNLIWQLLITCLNLNHAVANSAYNFSKYKILLYPIKLPIKDVNVQNSDYFKFFLLAYLIDMICELKFSYKINLITWTYLWIHTSEYFLSLLA